MLLKLWRNKAMDKRVCVEWDEQETHCRGVET
jgi:hypothetical protein